ncbi:MAG TPA: multicopper oxidase domain-containing protein [Thermoanaerobaculia bacterium]|nr:multicopper oxidase domain-containing protein [Thermoanaerobaculia bacterium]
MPFVSRIDRGKSRSRQIAALNRREIVAARLSRREMAKLGLLTSAGYLVAQHGLSARASGGGPESPPTTPWELPLSIPPVKTPVPTLTPQWTTAPNTAAGEGRTRAHQATGLFPPALLYEVHQRAEQKSVHPDLPLQTLWTFDGHVPGPTYHAYYGQPILVRNVNDLPADNGGFGLPSVSTHLHNGHTPSESDGFPCDFFERGQFYDHHYPNVLAGALSTHPPDGDLNESMSTLWYHDHRVDHTAENVYKGLAGFYLLFNQHDTGDEGTGFRLPSGEFDVPMIFTDRVFDQDTGLLAFDLMNEDGILGDKFLVNGRIQPFFQVKRRRYRFRWLDGGPSRFYQFHLTNPSSLGTVYPFWQISNDGNLLPAPIQVSNVRLSVAERADVIIDFSQFPAGSTIYLENRLEQDDGRGPDGDVLPAGQGNYLLRFDILPDSVTDGSAHPSTQQFYALPSTTATPRVTRTFRFERTNGQWAINGKFFSCNDVRFRVQKNSVERWILQNSSGGWMHPIHIHFEEFQILKSNGSAIPAGSVLKSRKDVMRLEHNHQVELFFRFRDFEGRYPMHCHNTLHEDHAMMLRWDIDATGDTKTNP